MKQRIFVYEHLSGGDSTQGDGELLAMGLAMRDAMTQDLARIEGVTVTCATSERAPAVPGAPGVVPVRAEPDESPFAFVRRQTQLHDRVWIVAPESGGLLACMRKVVGKERWIGCDSTAIRIASSKRATSEQLARHGVRTPSDFVGTPGVSRWVVKPDDGAGAVDTRVHASFDAALADLARRKGPGPLPTLEPWVDGEPISLSLLCRPGRAELLSINRQHIGIDAGGALRYEGVRIGAVPLDDPRAGALRDTAARVARAIPGLRGFVGIDVVWHPQQGPVVIEVNPRVTCAYVGLSARLGRPLAAEIVAMSMELEALNVA
jgi:predicted ATP-grasp superfamily ATP-dependent carboligase